MPKPSLPSVIISSVDKTPSPEVSYCLKSSCKRLRAKALSPSCFNMARRCDLSPSKVAFARSQGCFQGLSGLLKRHRLIISLRHGNLPCHHSDEGKEAG